MPLTYRFDYTPELSLSPNDDDPVLPAYTPDTVRAEICVDADNVLSEPAAVDKAAVTLIPKKLKLRDCESTITELSNWLLSMPEENVVSKSAPNGVVVQVNRTDTFPGHFEVDLYVRVGYGLTGQAEQADD